MSAPHENAQTATGATGDAETSAGAEGGREDLRALLALKAAAFRWTASRRPADGRLLADAARGLLVENERLREERGQLKAAVGRLRALAEAAERTGCGAGWMLDPAAVLAALDRPGESR